jgi:hypothetical protein
MVLVALAAFLLLMEHQDLVELVEVAVVHKVSESRVTVAVVLLLLKLAKEKDQWEPHFHPIDTESMA